MSTVTENDLKRLEDLINSRFDGLEKGQKTLDTRLSAIEIRQTEIKGEIKTLDAKINGVSDRIKIIEGAMGKIPDLAEKVGELKNWRQIVIITITATISGVIGWVIRGGNLKP